MFEDEPTIETTKALATGLYQGAEVVADYVKGRWPFEWENLRHQCDLLSFQQINKFALESDSI